MAMSLQNDFCSLCGVGKSQMNILQFEIMTKINQMFKQILCISSSINHSKYICSDCELSVQHFYKFWQMVQKVHKSISFIQHGEKSTNSLFPRLPIEHDDDDEGGLNLCHTTGITEDSEPVLIKINVVKQFQCHVCKMGLCFSQLLALHQVTHGLGTVACQCEQCGHQDDIGLFLQDKNNVHCPKCSFRKLNQVLNSSVDVQTQFNTEPGANSFIRNNSKETKNMEICSRQNSENIDIKMEYPTNGDVQKPSYSSDCTENLYQIDKYSTQYNRDQTGFPNEMNYETIPPDCINSHDYQMPLKTNSSCTLDEFKFNDSNYSRVESYNSSSQNKNHDVANYTPSRNQSVDNSVTPDTYPPSSQHKNQKCHVCEVCSRVFNHKGHLTRHMLVHDKSIKHFLCDECGRRFNQKSSLVTHWIHVHCKEKSMDNQFQCVWCGQVYKHKMNLKSHLLNNHNKSSMLKTKFYCNICDKYFISTSRLNMHSKIHLSVKEFQCPICKKSFNQKNNLNIHLKKHCPPKRL
uniref:Replication initiator 1 n=1 Tax=Cacopsylla melanoneura TaxID=428564 RepID=A0A8D8SHK2_9HEMI